MFWRPRFHIIVLGTPFAFWLGLLMLRPLIIERQWHCGLTALLAPDNRLLHCSVNARGGYAFELHFDRGALIDGFMWCTKAGEQT